jgi:DNA invertase Pin-like site-specific DNA recombinase
MSEPAPPSDQVVANMHVEPERIRELASGIDALYLSARVDLPADLVSYLELSREWATEMRRPAPCEIGGTYFGIAGHGYCRVSTEEQAAEGFSIAGQADKLRVYAELHDLGEVTVIADPGLSGKNLERPGQQQLLHMVDEGHVANALTWRLDRLSRNLGDLIMLADRFGQAGVALHSFTEKIDLSSATDRMFYNILGSFAQFYREQLAENVRMGMQQAVRQGKWVNRPKTGYDLVDGELVPNAMAPVVRRIFTLRSQGKSLGTIADDAGVKYSTVLTILDSRIYLGEVQMNGEWFPGAPRGDHHPGAIRCRPPGPHQGSGPGHPSPLGQGALRALQPSHGARPERRGPQALPLQTPGPGLRPAPPDEPRPDPGGRPRPPAHRRRRRTAGRHPPGARARRSPHGVEDLVAQRRKPLRPYYDDKVESDLFAEEEARLSVAIREAQREVDDAQVEVARADDVAQHFDDVARMLATLDVDKTWRAATEVERRVLVDEFIEEILVLPDYLDVKVHGAPAVHVLYQEVGIGTRS